MAFTWQKIIIQVVLCIFILLPYAAEAGDAAEAPPVKELKALYEGNKELTKNLF